jgi:two-component system sensor histidine kinase PilS (NtrC family)
VTSGLLTVDAAGRVTFLNRAGEQMSGRSRAELQGRPAPVPFAAMLAGSGRSEATVEAADGRRLQFGYSTFPLRGSAGAGLGQAVIFQDLTELRAMEERVARSERLADLGAVAAGLAHELRNPLASMMGSVELLRQSAGMDHDDLKLADIVLREAGRLEELVTQFLAYARPAEPQRVPVDLAAVAADTLAVFVHDPAAAGVTLVPALAPAPALADPDQLRQVLWNLLRNAAEAVGGGGAGREVRVATGVDPGGAPWLRVEDQGPGLAPADLPRLFLPFFTTKRSGTGLGLATVHRIVDAHGGAVSAGPAAPPGSGACFTVRLPPPPA